MKNFLTKKMLSKVLKVWFPSTESLSIKVAIGFIILIEHGPKSKIIKVLSDLDVDDGDRVEILGVLQKGEITPENIIVYKKWSYYSIFIRSAIAIPIVVYVFFKYWTFDFRKMKFKRRKDALCNCSRFGKQ